MAQLMSENPDLPDDPQERLAWLRNRVMGAGDSVEARRELGRLHAARGELQLALEQYEAARTARPDDVGVLYDIAETLVGLRRFDAAERELRRILKAQPDHGPAFQQLGIASFRRGLYQQAEQELARAVDLMPESAAAYFYRGEALNQLDRIDEALDMLGHAVQLDPENSRAYFVMGILYDKKNLPREAMVMYRKAREASGT